MILRQNTLENIFRKGEEWSRTLESANVTSPILSSYFQDVIHQRTSFWKMHFHIGYGLSKDYTFPLRLPVLIIPALSTLQKLKDAWVETLPTLVIYQATDFIIQVNKLEEQFAQKVAQDMQSVLQDFVSRYFPWSQSERCI